MSPRVLISSAIFFILGLSIILVKFLQYDVPLMPSGTALLWNVEARISFKTTERTGEISLYLPPNSKDFDIISENFISEGFPVATINENGNRSALWTVKGDNSSHSLSYQALIRRGDSWAAEYEAIPPFESSKLSEEQLEAAMTLIQKGQIDNRNEKEFVDFLVSELQLLFKEDSSILLGKRSDPYSLRLQRAVRVLNLANISSRRVSGIKLKEPDRDATLRSWVEIFVDGKWVPYDFIKQSWKRPPFCLPWRRGTGPLFKVRGVHDADLTISMSPAEEINVTKAISKAPERMLPLLTRLPVETQAVLRILLLIPPGALVIAFLRSIIGLRTFGTFMPVLMALAFRDTKLLWGVALFSTIVALGLLARFFFEKLQLLLVPRLTATLTIVILLILLATLFTDSLGLDRGLSVALFPIVILTMTIERMSIVWDEVGAREAILRGINTLAAASLAYLVISSHYVEYFMFVFPEVLFIILAVTILLGRYTGYKLSELYRFREFGSS